MGLAFDRVLRGHKTLEEGRGHHARAEGAQRYVAVGTEIVCALIISGMKKPTVRRASGLAWVRLVVPEPSTGSALDLRMIAHHAARGWIFSSSRPRLRRALSSS